MRCLANAKLFATASTAALPVRPEPWFEALFTIIAQADRPVLRMKLRTARFI
ncbi:MAG TPA: hypothetical protein VFO63_12490 [Blastocatellia bacterium]|nr:hypothetical protein [Blastocatellia bacterium]